jgi:hypothetical protein
MRKLFPLRLVLAFFGRGWFTFLSQLMLLRSAGQLPYE